MSPSYDEWQVAPGIEVWQSVTPPNTARQQRILPDDQPDLIFYGGRPVSACMPTTQ